MNTGPPNAWLSDEVHRFVELSSVELKFLQETSLSLYLMHMS